MHAWACVVHAWCMHVACIVHAWCMHGVTCMRPSVEFELCAPFWVRRHDFPSSHPLLPPRGDRHFHTYIPTLGALRVPRSNGPYVLGNLQNTYYMGMYLCA